MHVQELTKSRKSKKSNKKNVQENLIESRFFIIYLLFLHLKKTLINMFFKIVPNIETANITENFSLSKGDYVFVRYGSQICIGRVEALYFEAYNHHCYTDKPINDLNDISYISLHVFVPLHLDLFTDIIKEGCYILIHHIPLNIVYHIKQNSVDIEGNFLKLVGNEKNFYFNYFGQKDIIEKMVG